MNTNEYSYNDYRLYLEHSWGKKPEQKAAEKAYNQKYYQEHKSKWAQYREKLGLNARDKWKDAEWEANQLRLQRNGNLKDQKQYLDNAAEVKRVGDDFGVDYSQAEKYWQTEAKSAGERATLLTRAYTERQKYVKATQEKYYKTPLGKVEGAIDNGKSFISNLVKKNKKRKR